ncbi:MAG: L-threonylcarbamoyladenylate synthase, partial [Microgenomates group bacterium]
MEKIKVGVINKALKILKQQGLIVFPSDTVYGLLTDATSCQAVKKLIAFKDRPAGKPISVFVDSFSMLKNIVYVNKKQEKILKSILPGPFTVILKSKKKVCPLLESEEGTLGVRLIKYDLVNELVKHFKKPLTATSANISGHPPCHSIKSFLNQIPKNKRQLIDLIIDIGQLPKNKPSTVIDL